MRLCASMRLVIDGGKAGGMTPEIWLKLRSSVLNFLNAEIDGGMIPVKKFLLRARNRSSDSITIELGIEPMTRPGTRESSVRADIFPTEGDKRPMSPGDPAAESPRVNATTLSSTQNTPEKPQGSDVKSQVEKKLDPGKSANDFRTSCSARKSTGLSIPDTDPMTKKKTKKKNTGIVVLSPAIEACCRRKYRGVSTGMAGDLRL